jgi:hypothetical protein
LPPATSKFLAFTYLETSFVMGVYYHCITSNPLLVDESEDIAQQNFCPALSCVL